MNTFRLTAEFLERYADRKPPFGFNGLGEIVYYRTYSRIKADGSNERWWETVQRVVEGTYNMQRNWMNNLGLGWDIKKGRESAEEMYDRMYNFKFLPPGRGLWAMGSPITTERGAFAALNNCFAYETEIITRAGIKTLGDCRNTTQTLLSRNGKWVEAPIRSFGMQPLRRVTLRRQGVEKIVYATPDHRWFAKSPSEINHCKGFKEYTTDKLKPNYRMQYCFGQGINDIRLSPFGIAHGITFGDGTTASNPHLYLCGVKQELVKWFPLNSVTSDESKNALRVADLPKAYKEPPALSESKAYLFGWLAGVFATDGSCDSHGQCTISSSEKEILEVVRSVCAILGVGAYGIREAIRTSNLTNEKHRVYSVSLMRDTLKPEFFLRSEHRTNFEVNRGGGPRHWIVACVEDTDRVEEVFCATVPEEGAFTLADNILTGNCSFVSTLDMKSDPIKPFLFLMDASMLGVGVGFDTQGAGSIKIKTPKFSEHEWFVIPDSREGWVESVGKVLAGYLKGNVIPQFDYSQIRVAGEPIRGFGGVASGPEPLEQLHRDLSNLLDTGVGLPITARIIVDLMNVIGKCVVAGNVRRTAEIVLHHDPFDAEFLNLKNYDANPERASFGWTSNNSIICPLGMDYTMPVEHTLLNGEPGYVWLSNAQNYSRMDGRPDHKDAKASGNNPCGEQTLESYEMCNLVETFPQNHSSLADYKRTLKFAYLYAKTVTLGQTHWPETNRILMRNRRVGCSMSGLAQFVAERGIHTLREWCIVGYQTLEYYDEVYSDWLCVPHSKKMTSIKPSGTVSLLAGATPGMHWPNSRFYIRRVRLAKDSDLIAPLQAAGYHIEPCLHQEESTVVVEVPVKIGESVRTVSEVTMWEQLLFAAFLQRYWADNQVSCSITFDPVTEGPEIINALGMFQYQLKGISFLPRTEFGAYPQMPYETITEEVYEQMLAKLSVLDFNAIGAEKAEVERFCSNDSCAI